MEIKDPKVVHDYLNGVIEGEDVKKSTKLYSNAKNILFKCGSKCFR